MTPASILKKAKAERSSVPNNPDVEHERNYQVALHHANLIQDRKNIEARILEAIEELIDFPTQPRAAAMQPYPEDVARFRELITPFQTSDFDDLIEERHSVNKCAYVFCPRPTKHSKPGSQRIVWGSSRDSSLTTVPSEKVDAWCSKDCAKRAMYIKAQLNEIPAWERQGNGASHLDLFDDPKPELLTFKMEGLKLGESVELQRKRQLEELALERDEKPNSRTRFGVVNDVLTENQSIDPPLAPDALAGLDPSSHTSIEGYAPKIGANGLATKLDAMTLDDDENDWDLY